MTSQSIADHIWTPQDGLTGVMRQAVLVLGGTAVIAVSARIQVPMWPVPMTLQTLAVLVIALSFGARLATVTLAAYLVQGAVGLPVFSTGGGFAYLFSPTAGYLFGFLVGALVVGHLADRGWHRSSLGTLAAVAIGSALFYACGAGWLAVHVGADQAVALGVVPFLVGDLLKAGIAMVILPQVWALVSKVR
ncbi:MAG: biotin transporter BioY [Proteobacteria bacterium]|nr:biotin transporter BioY [Pseudomonadota bacterium]